MSAKPQYSRAAAQLAEKKSKVRFFAVDASKNPKVADLAGIQILPTFKLYSNGAVVADYDSGLERTADAMLEFCNKHAKVKDELWS